MRERNRREQVKSERTKSVWIHNVYNLSPILYESMDSLLTLFKIHKAFQKSGEHILIGDFKLHHPQWNNPEWVIYYCVADKLLAITQSMGLKLTLSKEAVTWTARGLESTIDLVFASERLGVVGCKIRKNLHHRSDYYPIATYLDFSLDLESEKRKQAWKSADPDTVLEAAKRLNFSYSFLYNTADIDAYVGQITSTLQKIVEQTVLWEKPLPHSGIQNAQSLLKLPENCIVNMRPISVRTHGTNINKPKQTNQRLYKRQKHCIFVKVFMK